MSLTKEELKMVRNNVMTVMENHIMSMTTCDRKTANLIANEVLDLDRQAEELLSDDNKQTLADELFDREDLLDSGESLEDLDKEINRLKIES